jgi:RNA polymerase sigma-70 factor, ECF subfamily
MAIIPGGHFQKQRNRDDLRPSRLTRSGFSSMISPVLKPDPTPAEMEKRNTDLLIRAHSGDADAFCELCQVHETRLLRQAMTLCSNPGQAEELAQDTLVEAWKCLHRFNGRCQLFTWLCAILLNRYRNTLREKRPVSFSVFRARSGENPQDRIAQRVDGHPPPDVAAQLREQAVLVHDCIEALPRKHQQVIYLRFYVDDSLEGIAAALGCSVGTVKSRLFHALEKLRRMNLLRGESANSTRTLDLYEAMF